MASLGGKWRKQTISLAFSIAAFFIVITIRDISKLQTYAGGVCGILLSLGIPGTAAYYKFAQDRYLGYIAVAVIIAGANIISHVLLYLPLI